MLSTPGTYYTSTRRSRESPSPLWGEDDGTHCVIDGRHRAARMLQLYGPTAELGVYLLTPAETARCVLLMPSGD